MNAELGTQNGTGSLRAEIELQISESTELRGKLHELEQLHAEIKVLQDRLFFRRGQLGESIRQIVAVVAREFDLQPNQLLLTCRDAHIAEPRMVAYHIARRLTNGTFKAIGAALCNPDGSPRDHGTILSGSAAIANRMEVYPKFKRRVNEIEAECKAALEPLRAELGWVLK